MNNIPSELRYTKTHEWLKVENGQATIGITEHAQQLLGELVYVELPALHAEVPSGGELSVVESVKAASDVYAPISGQVVAINEELINNPGLVNSAPYTDGWLVKLAYSDSRELDELLDAKQYAQLIAEEK